MRNNILPFCGFTLIELIAVIMIMSVMVAVAVPYATRSNKNQELKEECLNIVTLIKYAINLAIDNNKPTRIGIDIKNNSYLLEQAIDRGGQNYAPVDDFYGQEYHFNKSVRINEMEGFDTDGNICYLIFDPGKPWPIARFSISIDALKRMIQIKGKQIELENSAI